MGVSRGGDGALRPGQGMAWLAQESTGCEGREGNVEGGGAVMQEVHAGGGRGGCPSKNRSSPLFSYFFP